MFEKSVMVLQEHLSVGFSENLRSVWHLHAILFVLFFFLKKRLKALNSNFIVFWSYLCHYIVSAAGVRRLEAVDCGHTHSLLAGNR